MPWAGKGWGWFHIPRIGMEVVIQFERGNVDRPYCTGVVYNATNMPPYTQPANMTKTTLRTNSTKGGDPEKNFHEISMEDKKGAEEFFLQSERDYREVIKNNAVITIGIETMEKGDLTQTIYRHKTETLKTGNHTFKVESGNEVMSISNDQTEDIGHDRKTSIGNNSTLSVGKDLSETIGANATYKIETDRSETVGGNSVHDVGADQTDTIGANLALDVGENQSVNIGKDAAYAIAGDMVVDVGKSLAIEAETEIKLTVGGSSITITPTEISMKTTSFALSATKVAISADAMMALKAGGMMDVKADGMVTIKGVMIKAN